MIVWIVSEWCSVQWLLCTVDTVRRVFGVGDGVGGVVSSVVYDWYSLMELIVCAHHRPEQSIQWMWKKTTIRLWLVDGERTATQSLLV